MYPTIDNLKSKNHGFVTQADLPFIVAENRFEPLLVRCGACRFTAPAQNIAWLVNIIEDSGVDYVRDISFPVFKG